ncbi:MAG: endonuclease [Bacteroidaceae bacterium]|nr:endonuclease [Bacteroidaceae bacterium]
MKHLYKLASVLAAFCAALNMTAQTVPTPVQQAATNLKAALHQLIKVHESLGYDNLNNYYPSTDADANGKVWDMYSNEGYAFNQFSGTYSKEGDGWNKEHTVPQSWFDEQNPMKCDLFQVYPTDGYVNNRRGNLPYGEVSGTPKYTSKNGSKMGSCATDGYTGDVFEPIDEYKGDIARIYFYMATCYGDKVNGWSGGVFGANDLYTDVTGYPGMKEWALKMFLRWSAADPVSQKEIDRNNAVYKYQKNRNPFIDTPGLERFIWSDYITE